MTLERRAALRLAVVLLAGFACLQGNMLALAVQPALSVIEPVGFQRGTEVEAVLSGARISDAQELLFYSPGLQVKGIEPVNENAIKVKLAVAPDCRLGIHAVRLRSKTGVSNLLTFTVGHLPIVAEVEPNNEFAKPQPISMGCTIHGIVQSEDEDFFVVDAKKGERITAEIEGIRLGYTFFDPYVAILNSARFELSRSDDAALLKQDGLCSVIAPEDGKYIVQVRESAYGGDGNCRYRLHVGNFPRPSAVYPAGGRPGESLEVRFLGDVAGEFNAKITLPPTELPQFDLVAQDGAGVAASPNVVRVVELPQVLEAEPNDALAQANPGPAPGVMNGIIQKPGDVDFFKFTAKQGQQFDIRVYARTPLRSPLDPVLTILNAQGGGIVANDDSGGPDSYVRFAVPADGEYLALVTDHLKAGGSTYVYRLEISPVTPSLTMVLPERVQYIPTTLTVHRGNRMALMVAASRANFGGDLDISFGGMPAGLAFETLPMKANRSDVPVLFTAAPDAPLGGALADLVGRTTDPNLKVEGHLNQRTMLVRGQNNIDVWGHNADRMAVAVAEEVPFKIDIVQPKAPLVRNGAMGLKVVATRTADFKAPIAVSLLYNPPGIGSSGAVTIPEGQTEAVIPLTANSAAEIGVWKIVVVGQAGFGNGAVEVASQMAELNVTDVFFNFAFEKAAAEQGQQTEMVLKIEKKQEFEGPVKAQLLGLPANTSAEPAEFTKDSAEVVFKVKVEPTARPGRYPSVVCQAIVLQNGEPVTHTLGTGELRVDQPLPPKVEAPKPVAAAATPAPMPAAAPEVKRLSRLEQLRLEREKERSNAGK